MTAERQASTEAIEIGLVTKLIEVDIEGVVASATFEEGHASCLLDVDLIVAAACEHGDRASDGVFDEEVVGLCAKAHFHSLETLEDKAEVLFDTETGQAVLVKYSGFSGGSPGVVDHYLVQRFSIAAVVTTVDGQESVMKTEQWIGVVELAVSDVGRARQATDVDQVLAGASVDIAWATDTTDVHHIVEGHVVLTVSCMDVGGLGQQRCAVCALDEQRVLVIAKVHGQVLERVVHDPAGHAKAGQV